MKRLVSVFLVLCMMLSCVAFGETLDGARVAVAVVRDLHQPDHVGTQRAQRRDDLRLLPRKRGGRFRAGTSATPRP